MEQEFELDKSPFKSKECHTPVWPFRPRKFSSPFVSVPKYNIDQTPGTSSRDEHRGLSFDSGFSGSVMTDHDFMAESGALCPKYHNDGICEMGQSCPLVHEAFRSPMKSSHFDPTVPEFVPRSRRKMATSQTWHGAADGTNSIARDLTNLAISHSEDRSSLFSPFKLSVTANDGFGLSDERKNDTSSKKKHQESVESDWNRAPGADLWRRPRPTKFKTEPCTTFHTIGSCPYGDKCNFYHKDEERNVSKTKTRLCKSWNSGERCEFGNKCDFAHGCDELSVKYKTRMCKVFTATGKCPYGDQCTFAHDKEEKRKDISTVYKFKTEICQLWMKGECSFGLACHFAHGYDELQADQF